MNKKELLKILLTETYDTETAHQKSDDALLEFIDDEEVTKAFKSVGKWYA